MPDVLLIFSTPYGSVGGLGSDPVYFTGDAYDLILAEDSKPSTTAVTPEKLRSPSGYGVAAAAERMWNEEENKSVFLESRLAPIYLRKSQAEREREEKMYGKTDDKET